MRLDRDPDAALPTEFSLLLPIWNQALLPLPLGHFREIFGPVDARKARALSMVVGSRASGEHIDRLDAEFCRETHGVTELPAVSLGDGLVGMKRVTVAAERTDH